MATYCCDAANSCPICSLTAAGKRPIGRTLVIPPLVESQRAAVISGEAAQHRLSVPLAARRAAREGYALCDSAPAGTGPNRSRRSGECGATTATSPTNATRPSTRKEPREMKKYALLLLVAAAAGLTALFVGRLAPSASTASSHREAPLISEDP